MYGAILGDMIGAPYEFYRQRPGRKFELFGWDSRYTDDTVMTAAVAAALLSVERDAAEKEVNGAVVEAMRDFGERHPDIGYGGLFRRWLVSRDPKPYGSYGNGSAMRVSSAGWLYGTLERTREVARWTAEVTHDHPEGLKGAEATACAIFLARNGGTKEEIRAFTEREFGYGLSRPYEDLVFRKFDATCQGTVPAALTCFLRSDGFEDAVRTAVTLGGDTDTVACICGSVAEAFYGVPESLKEECRKRLSGDLLRVLDRFRKEAGMP